MTVKYFGLYVAEPGEDDPAAGYSSICVGLFVDVADVLAEAAIRLAERRHVHIDCGEMPQEEWDAIEEVPDDFAVTSAAAEDA